MMLEERVHLSMSKTLCSLFFAHFEIDFCSCRFSAVSLHICIYFDSYRNYFSPHGEIHKGCAHYSVPR
jgi:hypothetical protein